MSFVPSLCYAQGTNEMEQKFDEYYGGFDFSSDYSAVNALEKIRTALFKFLIVVIGIAALASLVMGIYNMMQGEPQSAKRMFIWFVGLAVGLSLLAVISTLGHEDINHVGHETAFSNLRLLLGNVMEIALTIVSMVTLAITSIHVMNGEKDGIQKLIRWFVISTIGLALLHVVTSF